VSLRHMYVYDAVHRKLHTRSPRILATSLTFILIDFICQLVDVQLVAREVPHCALVGCVVSWTWLSVHEKCFKTFC
jgi:hypothetical protein